MNDILKSNCIQRDSVTGIIVKSKLEQHLAIIPRGRELNMIKLEKNCGLANVTVELVDDGFDGHRLIDSIIVDHNLVEADALVTDGANTKLRLQVADMITAVEGDLCPICFDDGNNDRLKEKSSFNTLTSQRAIEVGHTFYLGTKYSAALDCNFKNNQDKEVPMEMGCYGVGVSRLVAAIAEVSRDKDGLKWPEPIAPFRGCIIMALGKNSNNVSIDQIVSKILCDHDDFTRDDLIVDDRQVSFGFKMKDALLIGYPFVFIAGKSFLETGQLEVRKR